MQFSVEEVVGMPYTVQVCAPDKMVPLPTLTEIAYKNVGRVGVVENTNVDPPSRLVGTITEFVVEETIKSDARPVVAPLTPEV